MQHFSILFLGLFLLVGGCAPQSDESRHLPSKNYNYVDVDFPALKRREKVYVPVYSDIYHTSGERRFSLTVTLSIRNTSMQERMYVQHVDFYDSEGHLGRRYLKQTIQLDPLESVEFVVGAIKDIGGAGANFIVDWGCDAPGLKASIQAVMIGTANQQGISFLTEGIVIEQYEAGPEPAGASSTTD